MGLPSIQKGTQLSSVFLPMGKGQDGFSRNAGSFLSSSLAVGKGSLCRGVCGPVLYQVLSKYHFSPFLSVSCALQTGTEQEDSMRWWEWSLCAVSNTGHWLSTGP